MDKCHLHSIYIQTLSRHKLSQRLKAQIEFYICWRHNCLSKIKYELKFSDNAMSTQKG